MQDFYRKFEDAYRGSEQLIFQRLSFYTPFIESLLQDSQRPVALDLGCGRGEWLKFLQKNGIVDFLGIDLNEQMLESARGQNLNVQKENALTFLSQAADNSYDLITAFHFVEHIDFPSLQSLVADLYRVLKPNGLIILETPNAENLVVGSNNFYLDPTHNKPIPSLLLEFMVRHQGFKLTTTARLQQNKDYSGESDISLFDVINGTSKDYAIVASKREYCQPGKFQNLFTTQYGFSLRDMLFKYDECRNKDKKTLADKQTVLENEIALLKNNYNSIKNELSNDNIKLQKELDNVYASTSWKITGFLRKIKSLKFGSFKIKKIIERIVFSKLTNKIYYKLYGLNPKLTLKIRSVLMRLVAFVSVKSIPSHVTNSANFTRVNDLDFFELSKFINRNINSDNENYSEYLSSVFESEALDPFFIDKPVELKFWILKLMKVSHLENDDFIIHSLPHNNIDHTIGLALYISLLGRLPGTINEVDYPIKHLCTVIINSKEYKEFSGKNLSGWFKS